MLVEYSIERILNRFYNLAKSIPNVYQDTAIFSNFLSFIDDSPVGIFKLVTLVINFGNLFTILIEHIISLIDSAKPIASSANFCAIPEFKSFVSGIVHGVNDSSNRIINRCPKLRSVFKSAYDILPSFRPSRLSRFLECIPHLSESTNLSRSIGCDTSKLHDLLDFGIRVTFFLPI